MSAGPLSEDSSGICLEEFEVILEEFERAARAGDLEEFRRLDHVLRSKALAVIGGMPDMQPGDDRYIDALREAVARLGAAAGEIQQERQMLKARRETDQRIRLAYSRK
ncbi:MAG: hypothetical protein R3256_00215 [Thalassovita sp.]|nr:hypothetical protein [Thalassovita sp.]